MNLGYRKKVTFSRWVLGCWKVEKARVVAQERRSKSFMRVLYYCSYGWISAWRSFMLHCLLFFIILSLYVGIKKVLNSVLAIKKISWSRTWYWIKFFSLKYTEQWFSASSIVFNRSSSYYWVHHRFWSL